MSQEQQSTISAEKITKKITKGRKKKRSEPKPFKVPEVIGDNEELQERFLEAVSLMNRGTANELLNRYDLGVIFSDVNDASKYGDHATGFLAEALGVGADWVYSNRNLAQTFSDRDEFKKLTRRKNRYGRTIGVSHLEQILKEKSRKKRDSLVERFFRFGLTVKDLRKLVCPKDKARTEPVRPKSSLASVTVLKRVATTCAEKFEGCVESWNEHLADDKPSDFPRRGTDARETWVETARETMAGIEKLKEMLPAVEAIAKTVIDLDQKEASAGPKTPAIAKTEPRRKRTAGTKDEPRKAPRAKKTAPATPA